MTPEEGNAIAAKVDFTKANGILGFLIGRCGSALEYPDMNESATFFFKSLESCLQYYGLKDESDAP